MAKAPHDYSQLEIRLGYTFKNRELLRCALTHSSAISPAKRISQSYQRLEFLGDRVLGLTVADVLYSKFPSSNEGDLSRSLNSVVRKETCADVARDLQLGRDIHLGDSEAKSGGAKKEAILADVCEAVIGAIYRDGGLEKAYDFVERTFVDKLTSSDARRADAKTALQEWAQGRGLPPPEYKQEGRTGPDHAPLFTISVNLDQFKPSVADGQSKKIAEHKAAEKFLQRENIQDWKK